MYSSFKTREKQLSWIVTANILLSLIVSALTEFGLLPPSQVLRAVVTLAMWAASGVVLIPTILDTTREPGVVDKILGIFAGLTYLLSLSMMAIEPVRYFGAGLDLGSYSQNLACQIVELVSMLASFVFIGIALSRAKQRESVEL